MEVLTVEKILQVVFGVALAVPGFTLLATVLVNWGKQLKWKGAPLIPDGSAPLASNILAVVFGVLVWALSVFAPGVNIPVLDEKIGNYANMMITVFPTILMLWNWLAPKLYDATKGVPLLGFSHSKG